MGNIIPRKNERLSLKELTVQGHIQADKRILKDDYEPHWHDYFEIEIITEGEIVHTLNGESCDSYNDIDVNGITLRTGEWTGCTEEISVTLEPHSVNVIEIDTAE